MEIPKSFLGYKRENGRAGTRNHVIILPVDDISNACAEAVANNIKGTIALPHSYGRLQFGADLELHFRTMIGTGSNPNVAAVIVIGIEPKWTKKIVDGIAKTGKPVEGFHIERTGDIGTVMKASKKAQEFVMWASEKQREECPISDLWISVKCGESDTTSGLAANPTVGNLMDKLEPLGVHLCFGETSELTGAEKVCATRGATKEASDKFMKTWSSYNDFILKEATDDLSESQPTAGNIAGGLTTIEEKAFGNFQKIGNCKFVDVLEPAEEPKKGKGLYFMDTSSAAAECVTLQAAAGFNIHLFPTGQGNIVGNPIEPVVKLTANPLTVKGMGEHIDCDVSKILSREMNMSQAGDKLIEKLVPKIEALKIGPYTSENEVDFGPVVTKQAQQRILSLVNSGIESGANLVVDGRNFQMQGYENGFFVGACLFDNVKTDMEIYKQEIFGPVLSTVRTESYEEALSIAVNNEYGNGTAIFTRDGDTARDFANRINIGMVGINVPIPVPLAYHTFGGWKKSAFGDLNQHGPDAFRFYTRTKTITSRWPTGIKEGAKFSIPTMD